MTLVCPKCAAENGDSAKFCKGCGQALFAPMHSPAPVADAGRACAKCGTLNILGAKFCKLCGASTAQAAPPPVPPPELDPEATVQFRAPPVSAPPSRPNPPPAPARAPTAAPVTDFEATIRQISAAASPKAAVAVPPVAAPANRNTAPVRYGLWAGIAVACLVLAGAAVIISRLVFPQIELTRLVANVHEEKSTAAAIVIASIVLFVALIMLALVVWAKA